MFDIRENYKISRKIAVEGMVLLKNEEKTLPFCKNERIGIIGKECLSLIHGGGGSAHVYCEYISSLLDGLCEKEDEGKIIFSKESLSLAKERDVYSIDDLNALSKDIDKAIVVLKRYASEGDDRKLCPESTNVSEYTFNGEANDFKADDYETSVGYFYPSERELALFKAIEDSDIKDVVLVLNIANIIDFSFIEKFPKIKSVLLAFLPGMESGRAICDCLCGDTTPCGKLADTVAYNYEDYPSSKYFNTDKDNTNYTEDIFVGYRHFETFAKDKVQYPFGFGLSYTDFEFTDTSATIENETVTVSVTVKNIGEYSGKEVVEVYTSSPEGKLKKPAIELRGFEKTRLLGKGEAQKITVCFKLSDMASFDTDGVTGFDASYVLEKGEYKIFVGNSVRNLTLCKTYELSETKPTLRLSRRFDGSVYENNIPPEFFGDIEDKNISLYDVSEGKESIYDFLKQLSAKELISLAQGQPPAFPLGTAGIGNLKNRGVPNPQTADGPAGIRRSVHTTCFPCGTLIACSWDKDLQYAMGKAMGYEGVSTGIDILLAPAMNIHRNPLCGRNFEYLSEDPLLTGKTAAALVNGVQSQGLCATIKHFAANNCEFNRHFSSSNVSERALREIYLKGFEIAVKESNPAYIMTSYNKINGTHTSEHSQLLRGVLREEWGYEGAVMTDWRTQGKLETEIKAGNNIKMPMGYPDHAEEVLKSFEDGNISFEILRENAYHVLKSVMKSDRFKTREFGPIYALENGKAEIPAVLASSISSNRVHQAVREDGTDFLYHLGLDQRLQRTYIYYDIRTEKEGLHSVSLELCTNCPASQIWIHDEEDKRIGTVFCTNATDSNKWYTLSADVYLKKGDNTLKFIFANEPDTEYDYPEWGGPYPDEDIFLSKITITRKK